MLLNPAIAKFFRRFCIFCPDNLKRTSFKIQPHIAAPVKHFAASKTYIIADDRHFIERDVRMMLRKDKSQRTERIANDKSLLSEHAVGKIFRKTVPRDKFQRLSIDGSFRIRHEEMFESADDKGVFHQMSDLAQCLVNSNLYYDIFERLAKLSSIKMPP